MTEAENQDGFPSMTIVKVIAVQIVGLWLRAAQALALLHLALQQRASV